MGEKIMFKIWSEQKPNSKKIISPSLEVRSWNQLDSKEKEIILSHFQRSGWLKIRDEELARTALYFINEYKKENYFPDTLVAMQNRGYRNPYQVHDEYEGVHKPAYSDFLEVYRGQNEDVVYELISYYAYLQSKSYDTKKIDRFCICLNEIFDKFYLNVVITKQGLIPRTSKQIEEEIIEPTLDFLEDKKWLPVNQAIKNAFIDYRKQKYDDCIKEMSNAIQAYLQIEIYGNIGKGDIKILVKKAREKNIIPNDIFSNKFIDGIISHLASERSLKSGAHPKKTIATEQDARLIVQLTMVTLLHWLQHH
ncbi:MAG: hypothetical protein V1838_00965 [Patescibacteria group bacterium]